MPFGVVNSISVYYRAVRPDHDAHSGGAFLIRAFRGAVGHGNRFIDVTQKITRQAYFVPPFLQIFGRAERNAENDRIFVCKILGSSTEPVGLLRSIIAERAWIKPQHDVFTRMIRQTYIHPILIGQRKGWRHASDFR